MSTATEDAESVDQFLARIASLKDRRDREDEERIRKVEEEILQGRKERQARRAGKSTALFTFKDTGTQMIIGNWADESHAFRTSAVDISLEVFPSAELICRDRVQEHGQPSHRPSCRVHPVLTDTNSYKITQT